MSENPVLSAESVDGEVAIDRAIRPQYLKDYRGQPAVTEQLDIFIPAAKARNEALDHILFCGPPGLVRDAEAVGLIATTDLFGAEGRHPAGGHLDRKSVV